MVIIVVITIYSLGTFIRRPLRKPRPKFFTMVDVLRQILIICGVRVGRVELGLDKAVSAGRNQLFSVPLQVSGVVPALGRSRRRVRIFRRPSAFLSWRAAIRSGTVSLAADP